MQRRFLGYSVNSRDIVTVPEVRETMASRPGGAGYVPLAVFLWLKDMTTGVRHRMIVASLMSRQRFVMGLSHCARRIRLLHLE